MVGVGCGGAGRRDAEKCDLVGLSATNGGFDLPAKSHCCYGLLFEKMEWKHFIFNLFCIRHPWFSCRHVFYATKQQQSEEKKPKGKINEEKKRFKG